MKQHMGLTFRFMRSFSAAPSRLFHLSRTMALSRFEYVKNYEINDSLLPNCWIIIRIDGNNFHKFSDVHNFDKPNDIRSLNLMSRAAIGVMGHFCDIKLAYGESDEYSFVFDKNSEVYKRRGQKIMSMVTSIFTSTYVYNWNSYFPNDKLKYPPCFDGRYVLYPSDNDLKDYLSWRQADTHINNLYNTTFWNLVQKSNMTPAEAEKFLSGTVAADKNEILFSRFNINYNNEPNIFKKGTILLRKKVKLNGSSSSLIINVHEDMIKETFWQKHSELLENKKPQEHELPEDIPLYVQEQVNRKLNNKTRNKTE